jgi:Protein of unknown function (DUF2817)
LTAAAAGCSSKLHENCAAFFGDLRRSAPKIRGRRARRGRRRRTSDGTSKSPHVAGPLIGCIEETVPSAETTSIGLEFGTVALSEVLDAIRGDNWLYARGLKSGLAKDSNLARDIKTKIRDALFIDADDWKEKVYARCADFALKAFRGLSG